MGLKGYKTEKLYILYIVNLNSHDLKALYFFPNKNCKRCKLRDPKRY